jgi:protease-4
VYDQFVSVVVRERAMKREKVISYADGRVFTGRQAYSLGFVDTLGTYEDAIMLAGKLGGIDGEPSVLRTRKQTSFLDWVFGGSLTELTDLRHELFQQPVIQYRFEPPY